MVKSFYITAHIYNFSKEIHPLRNKPSSQKQSSLSETSPPLKNYHPLRNNPSSQKQSSLSKTIILSETSPPSEAVLFLRNNHPFLKPAILSEAIPPPQKISKEKIFQKNFAIFVFLCTRAKGHKSSKKNFLYQTFSDLPLL